jgi:hypothetical protein
MGNRAAWNRVNKARKAEELRTSFEPLQARDPCQVAREEVDIAARRAAFPLH